MAGEIQLRVQLAFAKGGVAASADSLPVSINMTGGTYAQFEQTVSTIQEPLLLGDVDSRNALIWIKNLDATNFVEYRPDAGTGAPAVIIRAGQVATWRFPGSVNAPYVKADTSAVRIAVLIIPT